jgi:hypothetical protein
MLFSALLLKALFVASVIVTASLIAERSKPLIASLVLSLPVSAGPAYILLSFEQSSAFMAHATLVSVAANVSTLMFVTGYVLAAKRGASLLVSLASGYVLWFAAALFIKAIEWTLVSAVLVNLIAFPLLGLLLWRFRDNSPAPKPQKQWYDIPLRALIVMSVVVSLVSFAEWLGAHYTGLMALFPASYTSFIVLMHGRLGGKRVATIMINGFISLIGFVNGILALHLFSSYNLVGLGLVAMVLIPVSWSVGVMLWQKNK